MLFAVQREQVLRDELVQLDHPGVDHPLDGGVDQVRPLDHVDHRLLDAPPADQVVPGREPDVRLPDLLDRHDVAVQLAHGREAELGGLLRCA